MQQCRVVCVKLKVAVWVSGNNAGRINEVAIRRAGLILRWVTACGYVLEFNQNTEANSDWPSIRGWAYGSGYR